MNQGPASSASTPAAGEPTHFGSGWISGVLSTALGALGLGAVFCFRYPSLLTVPELRGLYPIPYVRALLHLVLVGSFVLGVVSVCLRQSKVLGMAGVGLTLIAALLGGSRVPLEGELSEGPYLGLDWFLLRLIVFSALFIPLERLFARLPGQPIFRRGWRTDLVYFFVGALLVQVTTLLTMKPAMVFFQWAAHPGLQSWVKGQPFLLQFVAIVCLADLMQYWVHRLFHTVPALWRFHAIHHSAEALDWLAGSRLHFVDLVVTRALSYVPIYLLGFAEGPLYTYVTVVSIWATFIHANVRFDFGPLRWLVATPQFHHWHHGAEREAVDKNFAVHLPLLDWLFGTYYLPDGRWPATYGLVGGDPVPPGFVRQFVQPFLPQPRGEVEKTGGGTGPSHAIEQRPGCRA
jgi:sterol desaturase/sphingolipid hydroxylase (fatty acid hydroxylase superfamily)